MSPFQLINGDPLKLAQEERPFLSRNKDNPRIPREEALTQQAPESSGRRHALVPAGLLLLSAQMLWSSALPGFLPCNASLPVTCLHLPTLSALRLRRPFIHPSGFPPQLTASFSQFSFQEKPQRSEMAIPYYYSFKKIKILPAALLFSSEA